MHNCILYASMHMHTIYIMYIYVSVYTCIYEHKYMVDVCSYGHRCSKTNGRSSHFVLFWSMQNVKNLASLP